MPTHPTFGTSRPSPPQPPGRVVTPRDLPAMGIHYHINHLRRLWQAGSFPKPFHLSVRRLAWPEEEITSWISDRMTSLRQPETPNEQ